MSDKIWTIAKDGDQMDGKFTTEEAKALIAEAPNSKFFVWKEGMAQWAEPRSVPEFGGDATIPPTPPPNLKAKSSAVKDGFERIKKAEDSSVFLPHVGLFDKIIDMIKNAFSDKKLGSLESIIVKVGHLALLLSLGIVLVFGVVLAIKNESFSSLVDQIALVILILIGQVTAYKFLSRGKELIASHKTQIPKSSDLRNYLGLVVLGVGTYIIIRTLRFSFDLDALGVLINSLITLLLVIFGAALIMSRDMLNLEDDDHVTPAEGGIQLIELLLKWSLRFVPFVFGLLIFGQFVELVIMAIQSTYDDSGMWQFTMMMKPMALLSLVFYPLIAYVGYMILYIGVAQIRAILSIPDKLDKMAK